MDQLRARAFMDILLGTDSRPCPADRTARTARTAAAAPARMTAPARAAGPTPHEPLVPAPAGPLAGMIPPGFAGRATLTIPATLLGLADRPGELAGIGPIDPDPGANT